MVKLEDLSDGELDRIKNKTIKQLCDRNHLPYPASLTAYLEKHPDMKRGNDGDTS